MWYAGIDWADQHHDVVIIDEQGKQLAKKRVAHSAEGLSELVNFLRSVGDVGEHPEHVACIIETNKGLLITALLEAGIPVYPVNPKTLEKWRSRRGLRPMPLTRSCWHAKGAATWISCAAWNPIARWCRNSSS